jgi:hypothetical protein
MTSPGRRSAPSAGALTRDARGVNPMTLLHQVKVGLVWLVVVTMIVVFVLL